MKLLPREMWTIKPSLCSDEHIIVSAWEHPPGYRYSKKVRLVDLPVSLTGIGNLEDTSAGVDGLDVATV